MARWALITDSRTHAKASWLQEILGRLVARGIPVGGFVQRRTVNAGGDKQTEVAHVFGAGERLVLGVSGKTPKEGEQLSCTHAFRSEVFAAARRWVQSDARAGCRVLVVDGVSELEAGGGGHADALRAALELPGDRVVVIGAHARHLFRVLERFGLEDEPLAALELPVDAVAEARFVEALAGVALVRAGPAGAE